MRDFNATALVMMKFGILLTIILFSLYAMLDHIVFPKLDEELLKIRSIEGVFLIALYTFLNYRQEYSIAKLQFFSSALTIVTGIILLKISSYYPENSLVYVLYDAGFVLFITAAFTVFGNRFINALVLVVVTDVAIAFVLQSQLDAISFLFLQSLFFSTILLSGFSAYIAEYNQRNLFLEHKYSNQMERQVQEYVKKLEKLSVTDKLTGLYNRVKLETEMERVMQEFQRYNIPCCVVLVDIDHFKAVNDEYGHLVGDEVLVKVASILRKYTRATDIVGRWGGEEFLIIAPNTTIEQAAVLAENLRYIIERENFAEVGKKTISIGVSCFKEGLSIGDVIEQADKALYEAKKTGRNKVVLATEIKELHTA